MKVNLEIKSSLILQDFDPTPPKMMAAIPQNSSIPGKEGMLK